MSIYLIILITVTLIALLWNSFAVPFLGTRGVNPALLGTVTLVVEQAVRFAEQMYKANDSTDRKALARHKVEQLMWDMGIDPGAWDEQIEWLIEAAVTKLPKTHME